MHCGGWCWEGGDLWTFERLVEWRMDIDKEEEKEEEEWSKRGVVFHLTRCSMHCGGWCRERVDPWTFEGEGWEAGLVEWRMDIEKEEEEWSRRDFPISLLFTELRLREGSSQDNEGERRRKKVHEEKGDMLRGGEVVEKRYKYDTNGEVRHLWRRFRSDIRRSGGGMEIGKWRWKILSSWEVWKVFRREERKIRIMWYEVKKAGERKGTTVLFAQPSQAGPQ